MKIKQRKPTNKCFSEPTNTEHRREPMADANMVIQDLLSQDVTFISQPLNHDHKLQLMSMTRDIMTMF